MPIVVTRFAGAGYVCRSPASISKRQLPENPMTLDRNLLDSGATIERTLTLAELGEILKENPDLVVAVDSPDGFVKVTEFLHHGTRPCVKVTFDNGRALECSIDHKIEVATDAGVNPDPRPLQIANLDKVVWEGEPQTMTEIDVRYQIDPSITPEPPRQFRIPQRYARLDRGAVALLRRQCARRLWSPGLCD